MASKPAAADAKKPAEGAEAALGEDNHLRTAIQARIDQKVEESRKDRFKRRLILAQKGIVHYCRNEHSEAMKCFLSYLQVVEDWKKAAPGALTPSLFNPKEESPELLLLTGVYWDLAKLFDRLRNKEKARDFQKYLNKFILFSKGTPFQGLCAESIRKYLVCERPVHKAEFKAAFKQIGTDKCFIATELVEESPFQTLIRLRSFRDRVLLKSLPGRAATQFYYWSSPWIASLLRRAPQSLRTRCALWLDRLSRFLNKIS